MRFHAVTTAVVMVIVSVVGVTRLATAAAASAAPPTTAPPVDGSWQPVPELTDEFDGETLDDTKWSDHNPEWPGRQPGFFSPKNVTVRDGQMHLTSRVEDLPNLPAGYHTFTTAAVQSKVKVLYGYFEAKCRPMNSRAASAFWFYANDKLEDGKRWWTEIDVFEISGGSPEHEKSVHMNMHVFITPTEGENHWFRQKTWKAPYRLVDDFHVYALLWDKDRLTFFVDGVERYSRQNTHWHQPLRMNFDSELMANWFGMPEKENLPSTFSIEYVRSWQRVAKDK